MERFKVIVPLILLILLPYISTAQCYNCTNGQWPGSTLSTTSNTLVNASTCSFGGEYSVYNVTVGETYVWTTCGEGSWDTQLTLFSGSPCGTFLAYNDDDNYYYFCGLRSTITWTATFTGQVYLLISRYFCTSQASCMTIQWACTSCGTSSGCAASAPYPDADPCYQQVITADPFCCTTEWDMFCEEAYDACNPGGGPGDINACSGSFYDPGGPAGNYGNNQLIETTICPDVTGSCVRVNFNSFNIENGWDYLDVYNGPTTAAPLIGSFTGTVSPGTIQANNPSGCLTFVFDSDVSVNYSGWSATISCADCDDLPPSAPEDCWGATTICSDETFSGNSSGAGVPELNSSNSGCLSTENQSSWFFFSPQSTGIIAFMLTPTPLQDYDFAIWGPYDEPSCPPAGAPLRCSWAAPAVPTGLQAGAGDNSEDAGGNGVVNPITVGPADVGKVYILMIDNWSASSTPYNFTWNLGGGLSLDCTPLPVDLLYLEGYRKDNKNELLWSTASETNADYYSIERSSDGVNFETIGQIPAAGNSIEVLEYTFTDHHPGNVQQYYLLKQVDFNGDFEYFGPVAIGRNSVNMEIQNPYPNPLTEDRMLLDLNIVHSTKFNSRIVDLTGRILIHQEYSLERGSHQLQVDLSGFAPGVYEWSLTDELGTLLHSSRIVK